MRMLTEMAKALRKCPSTPEIEKLLEEYEEAKATGQYIDRARALHSHDELQVDEGATISEADGGVWVSAWVWVAAEELGE